MINLVSREMTKWVEEIRRRQRSRFGAPLQIGSPRSRDVGIGLSWMCDITDLGMKHVYCGVAVCTACMGE